MEEENCYPVLTESKAWGKVASNVPDPPKCIENCRARFLRRVVRGYDESKLSQVCGILSKDAKAKEKLWELSCCNSMACGVQLNDLGQDPGVNMIINTCQNIGSAAVQDPGPPPSGYTCPDITADTACQKPFLVSDTRPRPTPATTLVPPSPSFSTVSATTESSTRATHSAAVETSGASTTTQSSEQQTSNGLPLGSRVAVGVSCALVILAIFSVVVCLFRRRSRRGYTQSIRSEIKHHPLPPANSPTPLISPSLGAQEGNHTSLTPPPRLKERRMLSSTLTSPTTSIFSSPVPGTPAAAFLQPPIRPPSRTKPPPRHDRLTGPPPFMSPSGSMSKSTKTASMSSAASNRTAQTITSGFPYPAPSSPSRPQRPHDAPLYVPNLVCPGPPPTRSLPLPPPVSPISLFRQTSTDVGHNVGLAIAAGFVPPRNPARGVVLGKESRDLCDLTESCARESRERDSWGSWSIGGGGPGISMHNAGGRVNSPVLGEADLERMGGGY